MKIMKLKVYWNRKNGQGRIHIPKRAFELCPSEMEVRVPAKFLKKDTRSFP